jgi:hypothetical protein
MAGHDVLCWFSLVRPIDEQAAYSAQTSVTERILQIESSGSSDGKPADQAARSELEKSDAGNENKTAGPDESKAAPPDENKAAAPDENKRSRLPWIWIPSVICLGLLVAVGYVGGRILASRPRVVRPVQIVSPAAPKQVAAAAAAENPVAPTQPEITPVAPVEDKPEQPASSSPAQVASINPAQVHSPWEPATSVPADLGLIKPQPGERYIQISALNTTAARKYVEQLRRGPLEPHLAPGPRPEIVRVLIGPFHDSDTLLNTRADLKAAGIDCFIRDY